MRESTAFWVVLGNRIKWVDSSRPATLGKEGEREKPGVAICVSAVGVGCSTDSWTWEWREDWRTYEVKGMGTLVGTELLFWKKGD